jgi:hypothetical protein
VFLKEIMRENDKALRKVGRDLDREKNKLEMEEKKLVSICVVLGI